jgi:hypothetical protein
MHFPKMVVDQKQYDDRLLALITDPECIIFFDTNILAKMFSLYQGARDEFSDWAKARKKENRIKIPAWCVQEYTNKLIRSQLDKYIHLGDFVKNTSTILPQLIRHLSMGVDDKTAKNKKAANRSELLQKIHQAQTELLKLLPLPSKKEEILSVVHHEILDLFDDVVLQSDIFELVQSCTAELTARFDNSIPPGFLDVDKRKNKLGDYIIWKEILNEIKAKGTTKVLYVSDDLKLDWVYAPSKTARYNGNIVSNGTDVKIFLIDPRLEYEATLSAGNKTDIMLISFEQLIHTLTRVDDTKFKLLAEAIQIINAGKKSSGTANPQPEDFSNARFSIEDDNGAQPQEAENGETIPSTGTENDVTGSDSADHTEPETTSDNQESKKAESPQVPETAVNGSEGVTRYIPQALADSQYRENRSLVGEIISKLRVYTWDVQNSAINSLDNKVISQGERNELFVLGRNILQAASGSSFAADGFISNLEWLIHKTDIIKFKHLVNGILYEIYFDSNNQFRRSNGKTAYLSHLADIIEGNEELHDCGTFMQQALTQYNDHALFIPHARIDRHKVTLAFISAGETEPYYNCMLQECLIDDKVVSVELPRYSTQSGFKRIIENSLSDVAAIVGISRYIPREYIETIYLLDGELASPDQVNDYIVRPDLYV